MKALAFLACLVALPVAAQTAPFSGTCQNGGRTALTQGMNSTNTLLGVVPSCTVTVYLHGTQTLATIYADSINTTLGNPFTANALGSVAPGSWLFFAAIATQYDVVTSGGIAPNTFASPVTVTLESGAGPGSPGVTTIIPGTNVTCSVLTSGYCVGNVTVNANNVGAGFQGGMVGLPVGQHVIIPPTTCTSTPSGPTQAVCSPSPPAAPGNKSAAACGTSTGALYMGLSASVQGCGNGGGFGDNSAKAIWTFPALPSYIHAANVTAVYLVSTNSVSESVGVSGGTNNVNFPSFYCNNGGLELSVLNNSAYLQTNIILTGWDPTTLSSVTCEAYNNYSSPGVAIEINVPNMLLAVYYTTDPAPPTNTATLVNPPLTFDNLNGPAGELGIDPNAFFPGLYLQATTLPLPYYSVYPEGTAYLIRNGATPSDCATGGGVFIVFCIYDASGGWTGYPMGTTTGGVVTTTSGTSTANHTFSTAFKNTPICSITSYSNSGFAYFSTAPTTTNAGVITYTNSGAQTFVELCPGPGGAW